MPTAAILWLTPDELALLNTEIQKDAQPSLSDTVQFLITTAAQPDFPGNLAHLPKLFSDEENDEILVFYREKETHAIFETHVGLVVPMEELHGMPKRFGFITDLQFNTLGVKPS